MVKLVIEHSKAMAYVHITKENGDDAWGVGLSSNVGRAGVAAVVSALNFWRVVNPFFYIL